MKVLALTLGEDIIARNILDTAFWPTLHETLPEHRFVLLVPEDRADQYAVRYAGPRVEFRTFKRAPAGALERFIMMLARSGIHTHTNLWSKMRSYKRGDSGLLATWSKRVHTAVLGRSNLYKRFLRRRILGLPPDASAEALLRSLNPDTLICLSLTNFEFDVPLARTARTLKIPLLGMVRSWDNLSSHGLLRVVPDTLYLQNSFLKKMAIRHQAIDDTHPMRLVGLPHYDEYAQPTLLPRDEFFRRIGIPEGKKVVFYGAMGEFLFPAERGLPACLERLAAQGKFGDAVVVYRAHPKFKPASASHYPHLMFNTDTAYTDKQLEHLLAYADAVVTAASTVAIDSLIFGRRPICIGFDPVPASYWESVGRFYDTYTHFEAFMGTGAAVLAPSEESLVEAVHRSYAAEDSNEEGCAAAKKLLVEPLGQAGARLARAMAEDIMQGA